MARLHTHYDNLKVSRDAPAEVIRAAYKTLSQKYHPDRNPGNERAARVMKLLNTSYAVLSDPDKRHEHDRWITTKEARHRQNEAKPGSQPNSSKPPSRPSTSTPPRPQPPPAVKRPTPATKRKSHLAEFGLLYAILSAGLMAIYIIDWKDTTSSPMSAPPSSTVGAPSSPTNPITAPSGQRWVRPIRAPNGTPWPTTAGYLAGYPLLATSGLCELTIDNSRNGSDVFVKIFALSFNPISTARQLYIPAGQSFLVRDMSPGRYDVRYRDLSSGGLSRSEEFILEQSSTGTGTEYSSMTMTLYRVIDGNMQTYALSEAEF